MFKDSKVIIVGASSGIGKAMAEVFSKQGAIVGLMARRTHLLKDIKNNLTGQAYIQFIDVSIPDIAQKQLLKLINQMNGMDILILNSGIGIGSSEPNWELDKKVIDVNVYGFVALANFGAQYFIKKGAGHIVGISSIASMLYHSKTSSYPASKAFICTYLKGLRLKLKNLGFSKIYVTDIKPGYVDTPMTKDIKNKPFLINTNTAGMLILKAIKKKKRAVYVPNISGWGAELLAFLLRIFPQFTEPFLK